MRFLVPLPFGKTTLGNTEDWGQASRHRPSHGAIYTSWHGRVDVISILCNTQPLSVPVKITPGLPLTWIFLTELRISWPSPVL